MSEQNESHHYSMIFEWDPRDGIYVVTAPDLPGCRTHGRTLEEAVPQGQDAIDSWIRHWGCPIPPPRYFDEETADEPWQPRVATAAGTER